MLARVTIIAACSCLWFASSAGAERYPERPVRLIVPWPPGGGVDILARTLSPKLTESLGQSVVVDNRAGASGMLGTGLAARSPADGYTLLLAAAGPNAILPSLVASLPYDSFKDFAEVTLIANTLYVLVVHPAMQVNSVRDLVAFAKSRPGQLTIGSAGSGTPAHLAGELFKAATGISIVHVSYKGAAAPVTEVMGGQISMTIETISPLLPHIRGGKLKALGVTSGKRTAQLPDVPTIAESGYPDVEVINWYGLLAPAGTPHGAIARLNRELTRILQQPEVRDRMLGYGLEVLGSPSAEFSAFRKTDFAHWKKIVATTHARFE
jgi:tripartite-type tricarboxylate transporter receptor subunit TctC